MTSFYNTSFNIKIQLIKKHSETNNLMKLSEKIQQILADGHGDTQTKQTSGAVASTDGQTKLVKKQSSKEPIRGCYSFEYFPPKTDQGLENLIDRIDRMAKSNPLWVDITWNAGGVTSDITLELSSHIQKYMNVDVLMHITCTFMTREKVIDSLNRAKEFGIRNLLALRGDPPRGATDWVHNDNGFNYAADLVKFIKETYGDWFTICVAGYPEVHLTATSREDDIKHLKEKVDAGADFIITQLFYDNNIFYNWVDDCRAAGITVPIIPGIMPILGYERFKRMCKFTKTIVPKFITNALETMKHDDSLVQDFGVQQAID